MALGPIVRRGLVMSSRRWATYSGRSASALIVLAILAVNAAAWSWAGLDFDTLAGRTRFSLISFAAIVLIQAWATTLLVLGEIAPLIAAERERKTLDALLVTRLSSAEIVLGILASGLVKHLSGFAAALPLLVLMISLGGIDPRLVVWAYAGMLATMFAVAAIAMATSIGAPNRRRAVHGAGLVGFGWILPPFLIAFVMPRVWPSTGRWMISPALVWLDGGPLGVVANVIGLVPQRSLYEQISRMIACELLGGSFLILLTIARLRPACRAAYDGELRSNWLLKTRRVLRKRWPACGDDPIFWRERYMRRGAGIGEKLLTALSNLFVLGCLVFVTYWFGEPAFRELLAFGYGASSTRVSDTITSPLTSAIMRGLSLRPVPGMARLEFNLVIRQITAAICLVYTLVLAGLGAEGIAVERVRDTWLGLIATPLSGREILRAKVRAAIWRLRAVTGVLLVLWVIGLGVGALHPLGFLAAVIELAVASWFLAAFGIYCSLYTRDLNSANTWTILPLLLAVSSALLLRLPALAETSAFLGILSMPFRTMLSLVSYEDVQAAVRSGEVPHLVSLGVETGEGSIRFVLIYLIGMAGQICGAVYFTHVAGRGFDAAVGRPIRQKSESSLRAAEATRA